MESGGALPFAPLVIASRRPSRFLGVPQHETVHKYFLLIALPARHDESSSKDGIIRSGP